MSVNVRCAGLPVETRGREEPTDYDVLPPCGWSGKRRPGTILVGPDSYDTRLFPCPHCGGRVELIPERAA